MKKTILVGKGHQMLEIPYEQWKKELAQIAQHGDPRINFMTEEHHQVRYFVARELPRIGKPLTPECISQAVKLPLTRTKALLDDLEQHLVFLVRNLEGSVSWAFPVTVDPTPHQISFSTGEQLYAA